MKDPKEIEINGKAYILHQIPATKAHRIAKVYLASNLPKIGDIQASEEIMLEVMRHVSVILSDGREQYLLNADLVDNHVPDAGSLFRLEKEMLEFNFDFFTGGKILNCLKLITDFAEDKIIEILSQSLAQSSTLDGQPSTN